MQRTLRGTFLVAAIVCILDWGIKAMHPWLQGWWIPHQTERPEVLVIIASLILCPLVASLLRSPGAVWGSGMLLGGILANMLDLLHNGVVWDMIPLPWDPDHVINLADVFIVSGCVVLLGSLALQISRSRVRQEI